MWYFYDTYLMHIPSMIYSHINITRGDILSYKSKTWFTDNLFSIKVFVLIYFWKIASDSPIPANILTTDGHNWKEIAWGFSLLRNINVSFNNFTQHMITCTYLSLFQFVLNVSLLLITHKYYSCFKIQKVSILSKRWMSTVWSHWKFG